MSATDGAAAAVLLAVGLLLLAAAAWMATTPARPPHPPRGDLAGRDGADLAGDIEAWLRREGY